MMSMLFTLLGFAGGFVTWNAYSSLIERLAAHHPDVYAQLGSPTRKMAFWYPQPARERQSGGMGGYLWGFQFRTTPGDGPTRALGWVVVVGQILTVASLALSYLFRT